MEKKEISCEKEVFEKLEKLGINKDGIIATLVTDLDRPANYGKTTVCALEDSLCVIGEDGSFFLKNYKDISDVYTDTYVSSGSLIIREGENLFAIADFTLAVSARVEWFVNILHKLLAGEKPDLEKTTIKQNADFEYINNGRKKLFFRVLSYVPKYKKQLFAIMSIIILSTFVNLLPPYLSGSVLYDEVLNPNGKYAGAILPLVSILVLIAAITVGLGILLGRVGAEMSGLIIYDIKTDVFSAMQNLGMSFFSSKRTGNLLNRINSDALDIQYFLNDGLPNFIINAATICAIGLFLFIVNPVLSIAVLIPVPVIALIIKKSTRKFKKIKWHSWRRSSAMNSVINDTLMGVRVVKAFGKEDTEIQRFNETSRLLAENRIREGVAAAKVFPMLSFIMSLGGFIVWGIGGGQVLRGELTFGELMTFVGYLSLLYAPVNFMVKTFDWWTNCMNSAQRIFEVIDRKTDVPEKEDAKTISVEGNIELKQVSFSYEPNRAVLKNVSLKVKKGEMIGLVGHSGAGKSTITNLITRLYDVNDGEVLIDGVNVKDLSFECLRGNIGMVLQDTFLFEGTIAENIAYGKPDASVEEIVDAAKKAYAHDFITSLPDGYDTLIGKGGSNLSGGEKQRVSIARAILMNPPILIFDEATASLDTKTEQQIQKAMDFLMQNRTTIAIAHRFSTLKNANRLVVVEKGEIVEEGTHEELFNKKDGVYARMAHLQLDAVKMESPS